MSILARAVGRRKEAVAQVQLLAGTGKLMINHKSAEEYLPNNLYPLLSIQEMLRSSAENLDTVIQVKGGGYMGQVEAIKLGVARAVCQLDSSSLAKDQTGSETVRKTLKAKGYLTQDARVKERRKYGLKKARKATQYNKR
jgi:small subunit ribosomal protein S9